MQGSRPTLILTWIPNKTLQKHPHSIENSPNRSASGSTPLSTTPRPSPRRATPRQEFAKADDSRQSAVRKQKADNDKDDWSLSSDVSVESREETASPPSTSTTPGDDAWRTERKLSSSCKSQTDSGIGSEEPVSLGSVGPGSLRKFSDTPLPVLRENSSGGDSTNSDSSQQNNTKLLSSAAHKPVRVGINVNDLNAGDMNSSHADNCDVLTSEEQLAAMLNRPKLHAKLRSKVGEGGADDGAYSIHMAGDSLVIMSDSQTAVEDRSVSPGSSATDITDRNINTNDNKFDTSTASSAQSTDVESPSGGLGGSESPYSVSTPNTVHASPDSSTFNTPVHKPSPRGRIVGVAAAAIGHGSSAKPCVLELPGATHVPPNTPVDTPDIAITHTHTSSSSSSTTTSGPDSPPISPTSSDTEDWDPASPSQCGTGDWSGQYGVPPPPPEEGENRRDSQQSSEPLTPSSSSSSYTHNFTFPENAVSFTHGKRDRRNARDQMCGVFSVDLGKRHYLFFITHKVLFLCLLR